MISIQKWSGDRTALEDLYAHTDQSCCLVSLPVPLPKEKSEKYLDVIRSGDNDGKPFLCFEILEDGERIGKIDLTRCENGTAELDIIIRREYTDLGYGKKAMALFLAEISRIGWCDSIHAYCDKENTAVRNLLGSCGFTAVRPFRADVAAEKNGRWYLKEVSGIEYAIALKASV